MITTNPFQTESTILITCPKRMTPYLKAELEYLNYPVVQELSAGIQTKGTGVNCMELSLLLRTGHKVLYLLDTFAVQNPDELYKAVFSLDWESYLLPDVYLSVSSHVENETILNTSFASLKCKDAIVDKLTQVFNKRPDSGPDKNKAVVHLHWKLDQAAIYLDMSGESISRHGYRKIPGKAPMQETLAAAVIMATDWDKQTTFINPMCGSGTLAIEAALLATGRSPGLYRDNYGFMHLKSYEPEVYQAQRAAMKATISKSTSAKIIASDINPMAIEASRRNAATAGVDHLIEFIVCDFSQTPIPAGPGVVVINPEYGERLGDDISLVKVYEEMGDFFKKKCRGYTGYIFTGNMNLAKKIGLKTRRKIEFYNSTIDCRLLEYELYEGTRRQRSEEVRQQ